MLDVPSAFRDCALSPDCTILPFRSEISRDLRAHAHPRGESPHRSIPWLVEAAIAAEKMNTQQRISYWTTIYEEFVGNGYTLRGRRD